MPVEEKLIPLLDRVATFTYLMVDIRESRRMQAQAGDLRIYICRRAKKRCICDISHISHADHPYISLHIGLLQKSRHVSFCWTSHSFISLGALRTVFQLPLGNCFSSPQWGPRFRWKVRYSLGWSVFFFVCLSSSRVCVQCQFRNPGFENVCERRTRRLSPFFGLRNSFSEPMCRNCECPPRGRTQEARREFARISAGE